MVWQTARFSLDLAARPLVMGIVNVTTDSFSDGGRHAQEAAARQHCEQLLAEGAGAGPLAAALDGLAPLPRGSKVVAMVSGGNQDLTLLARWLTDGVGRAGG